jgi:hypothetical protein
MKERLVDVKHGERTVHTFPVTVKDRAAEAKDEPFKAKALEAAALAKAVPDHELPALHASMHISRGGPLEPWPDPLGVMAETKAGLEQLDRERAYELWEQAGRPEGRADEFWHAAQHRRWCDRAHALWEREGRPEGRADDHWHRVRRFEES